MLIKRSAIDGQLGVFAVIASLSISICGCMCADDTCAPIYLGFVCIEYVHFVPHLH